MSHHDIAARINDAHSAGRTVHIQGRRVIRPYLSPPAHVYANGTLEVTVQGRRAYKIGHVYVKWNETAAVDIT